MSFQHWNVKVKFINENEEEIEVVYIKKYKEKIKKNQTKNHVNGIKKKIDSFTLTLSGLDILQTNINANSFMYYFEIGSISARDQDSNMPFLGNEFSKILGTFSP